MIYDCMLDHSIDNGHSNIGCLILHITYLFVYRWMPPLYGCLADTLDIVGRWGGACVKQPKNLDFII